MKTIDRIVEYVKRDGSATAKQLADLLEITTMGARLHLQALEEEGILQAFDVKAKVGRPSRHWALTQKGHQQFADRHADLAVQLLDAMEATVSREQLQAIIDVRHQANLKRYQNALLGCDSLEQKLQAITTLREQEGYMATLQADNDSYLLLEHHCPICRAAERQPLLCQSEIQLFKTLLGDDYLVERTAHIIAGERRCAYRISHR
uniref:helix-turn-helix transcriptional regulator n=1 Tax=Thaumasiovibrio occultus TaxID=1891184 RepID=UPI000B34F179|nr:metalloregulator ArsR/SmtB family transcription factor [Thaumasiovibrio occultus]